MAIEQQVIEIVSEQLGIDKGKIDRSKKFVDDLDADSLDLTELIMTVEDQFNCEISESDAEKIKTVGDVIDYIESKQAD